MALASLAAAIPTPARATVGGTKRDREDGSSKKETKTERRALRKALAEIRRLTSECEDCYIFDAKDVTALSLKAAKDLYNSKKPERDPKAEKGTPHPMGPNRWILFLQLIEDSLKRYQNMPETVNLMKERMQHADKIYDALTNMVTKISGGTVPLNVMETFIRYCETRTCKNGSQILHITCRDEYLLEDAHDACGLTGFTGKQVYTVVLYPFRAHKQTGVAPASSEERDLAKLLKDK